MPLDRERSQVHATVLLTAENERLPANLEKAGTARLPPELRQHRAELRIDVGLLNEQLAKTLQIVAQPAEVRIDEAGHGMLVEHAVLLADDGVKGRTAIGRAIRRIRRAIDLAASGIRTSVVSQVSSMVLPAKRMVRVPWSLARAGFGRAKEPRRGAQAAAGLPALWYSASDHVDSIFVANGPLA